MSLTGRGKRELAEARLITPSKLVDINRFDVAIVDAGS